MCSSDLVVNRFATVVLPLPELPRRIMRCESSICLVYNLTGTLRKISYRRGNYIRTKKFAHSTISVPVQETEILDH